MMGTFTTESTGNTKPVPVPPVWPQNSMCSHWLLFSPTTSTHAVSIAKRIAANANKVYAADVKGFASEKELHSALLAQDACNAAFSFYEDSGTFLLWWNSTTPAEWKGIFGGLLPDIGPSYNYADDQRVPLMRALSVAEMQLSGHPGCEHADLTLSLKEGPGYTPPDNGFSVFGDITGEMQQEMSLVIMGQFFIFIVLFPLTHLALSTVQSERRDGHRDHLRLLGLKDAVYWLTTGVGEVLWLVFVVLGLVVCGYSMQVSFFSNTDVGVIVLLLFTLSVSLASCGLLLSTWAPFRTSSRAANWIGFAAFIAWTPLLLSFIPSEAMIVTAARDESAFSGYLMFTQSGPLSFWWRLLHIFPTFPFARVYFDIALRSGKHLGMDKTGMPVLVDGPGYKWADLSKSPSDIYHIPGERIPSALDELGYMLYVSLGCYLLAYYIDAVFPGPGGGTPRPFLFPFYPSFWGYGKSEGAVDMLSAMPAAGEERSALAVLADTDPDVAAETEKVTRGGGDYALRFMQLCKTYRRGRGPTAEDCRALDMLSLGAEEGQVLALLGHNGAGKTTAIRVLLGLEAPSSGDVFVHGYSAAYQPTSVRPMLGVCQQEDILYPGLSPLQHFMLYAGMRGVPKARARQEAARLLQAVRLTAWSDRPTGTFSGGMRRRLSAVLACIGNPRILVLDEPTTGTDPQNRRYIWDLIRREKRGRHVLLTSHSLEEADALGDKIAVLALGRLRAVGPSLHLKSRWGAGYHLKLVLRSRDQDATVRDHVLKLLPQSNLESSSGGSLHYTVAGASLLEFKGFFRFAEAQKQSADGMLADWSISHTTLEEVFLRLTHGDRFGRLKETGIKKHSEDAWPKQLNISVEHEHGILGFVDVRADSTLAQVRVLANRGVPDMPGAYSFLVDGRVLSSDDETRRLAVDALPLVTVRRAQGGSVPVESDSRIREVEAKANRLERELEELRAAHAALLAEHERVLGEKSGQ